MRTNSIHKAHPRPRIGKTQKDRANGAFDRHANNMMLRADWCNDDRATSSSFPAHTCNGKKNRFYDNKGRAL